MSVDPHHEMMGTGGSEAFFSTGQSPRLTTNSTSGSLICSGRRGVQRLGGEGEGDGWEGEG